jgi:serine protease Do
MRWRVFTIGCLAALVAALTQGHAAATALHAGAGPEPPSLEELYATVESGVLSIAASACGGSGSGTAFLISPSEAVTAAHVVDGSVSIALVDGQAMTVGGTVDGIDASRDVALIRLDRDVEGYNFAFASAAPEPGESVVAIGFPLDQGKSITAGTVSGLGRELMSPSGVAVTDLIQADVAVSPGSSGGPLLNDVGEVVGVVVGSLDDPYAQGLNYAASTSAARPTLDAWRLSPHPQSLLPICEEPLGPADAADNLNGPAAGDPLTLAVMDTFEIYFTAVNLGDYETAWNRSIPAQRFSLAEWTAGMSTSFNLNVFVHEIVPTAEGAEAWVTFTSLQMPELGPRDGESCTMWSIDYRLVPADDGLMLLAGGDGHAGGPISRPC